MSAYAHILFTNGHDDSVSSETVCFGGIFTLSIWKVTVRLWEYKAFGFLVP